MHDTLDPFVELQVHYSAEPEVIEAAYKRLAAKYHPDVNPSPDAKKKMQRLNLAREILTDPKRRERERRKRAEEERKPEPPPAS